jgi:hypothetical protein
MQEVRRTRPLHGEQLEGVGSLGLCSGFRMNLSFLVLHGLHAATMFCQQV